MRIVKFASHGSVDRILKLACPEMEVYCLPDDTLPGRGAWNEALWMSIGAKKLPLYPGDTKGVGIGWNLEHYYNLKEVDLFIIDDFWTHYLSQQLYPKKKAWYIHGIYRDPFTEWYIRKHFVGLPVIAGSEYKLASARETIEIKTAHVHKPYLDFEEVKSRTPNGRVAVIQTDFFNKMKIYEGDRCQALWERLLVEIGDDKVDLYGFGNELAGRVSKGFANNITQDLKNYSLGMFPILNRQPSYSELELMQAGVPVVLFGTREHFPEELNWEAYVLADEEDAFVASIHSLLNNPDRANKIGEAGRNFVNSEFSGKDLPLLGGYIRSLV